MGLVLEAFRESQLRRNRLPDMRALSTLPRTREGVFPLGVCAGGGRLEWSPTEGDPPHLLWAGTTGSGKTRGMVMLGLLALDWGWDVEVIDFKGGGDYWVLANLGAKVWITPEKSIEALQRASVDIRERNRAMWQTPMVIDTDHGPKVDRAVNFADLDPSVRDERGWKPRLILIDETASIVTFKQPAKQKPQNFSLAIACLRSARATHSSHTTRFRRPGDVVGCADPVCDAAASRRSYPITASPGWPESRAGR